jgi:hypothetical protein
MNTSYMQTVFDETIKTVAVSFDQSDDIMTKLYTYKTRLDLKPHDFGVVLVGKKFEVVRVVEAHDEPEIDPGSSREFKWLTIKLDVAPAYAALQEDQDAKKKIRAHLRRKARLAAKRELTEDFGDSFILGPTNATDEFEIENEG